MVNIVKDHEGDKRRDTKVKKSNSWQWFTVLQYSNKILSNLSEQSWITIFAGCSMIMDEQVDRFLQSNCLQSITVFQKSFSSVEYI